jgi:hypothetical protein
MDALERIQARHLSIERRLEFEAIMLRAFAAIEALAPSKEESPYVEPCDKLNDERDGESCDKPSDPKRPSIPFPCRSLGRARKGREMITQRQGRAGQGSRLIK